MTLGLAPTWVDSNGLFLSHLLVLNSIVDEGFMMVEGSCVSEEHVSAN